MSAPASAAAELIMLSKRDRMKSGMMHGAFREMRAGMLPQIARGLLQISAPGHALEVLDSIKDDADSGISVLKGTSLSLLERDQEALPWFEGALNSPMEDKVRVNSCRNMS